MPNMFGGDQFHPSYDPTTKVGDNQVMIGNLLWTADGDGPTAVWEDVSGNRGRGVMPQQLKDKLTRQKPKDKPAKRKGKR
jgi:hypothetical protein